MKKLLVFIMVIMSTVLSSCLNTDDYYTKQEINTYIVKIEELEDLLEAQEPTQQERYLQMLLNDMLMSGYIFTEIGQTVTGTVEDWGYSYVVLEVDVPTTVDLKFTQVAPGGNWDINVYLYDQLSEATFSWTEIMTNTTKRITLQPGFTTIEFDSYYDFSYDFTLQILQVI